MILYVDKGTYMNKDDRYLEGLIEDKIERCIREYSPQHTGFLDRHQQSVVRKMTAGMTAGDVTPAFYGGYEDSERVIFMALPQYITAEEAAPLTVIRASHRGGGKPLTHRDYLGALTGLGIKRELTGDILVREDGADIIVLDEIAEFIMANYAKAGRTALSIAQVPLWELIVPEKRPVYVKDTLASLRLDNVVASGFSLSRSKAAEAIRGCAVFVDNVEVTRPDARVAEGSKITLRGRGRILVRETGGKSRKDRIYVTFEKYL